MVRHIRWTHTPVTIVIYYVESDNSSTITNVSGHFNAVLVANFFLLSGPNFGV